MEYSDLDLVRAVKSGDRSALDILVRRWYPRIYGYAFKMIANEQDAYDITQDVFIAIMQNLPAFYPWKKFSSWLFTIAHNKCMDYFRMQRHTVSLDTLDIDRPENFVFFDETIVDSAAIENALKKLSSTQRETIILHYFYHFTAKEISRMTQTPLPTIKSRIVSAKGLLLKLLREDFV